MDELGDLARWLPHDLGWVSDANLKTDTGVIITSLLV
jgi:hypothetical protein